MNNIEVMHVLIAKLRDQIKHKPSVYRQDQLARAKAELQRRMTNTSQVAK